MSKIITITGALGSGKSTVAKMLCSILGFQHYSTGDAQRKIADEMNITTLELNHLAETDKSIDEKIDGVFKTLAESGQNYVIDSRLAWHFIPDSFKIKLDISPIVAAQRVMNDTQRSSEKKYTCAEEALKYIVLRRASEVDRFKKYYHIDIEDNRSFDMVIDTSKLSPDAVCQKILAGFEKTIKK